MADKKISALTGASTPLAGTEVLPIVQSGATVKVAVSDLTAGRAISAASLALTTSPLPVSSGGTGATTFSAGRILYGNNTSAVQVSGNLTFDGSNVMLAAGYLNLSDANSLGKITSPAITLTGAGGGGTGGQTVNIATSGTVLGFLTVASTQGECATFFLTTSTSLLISQTAGTRFTATSGAGNTANIYVSGSNVVLENNIQATRSFYVSFLGRI